MCNVNEFFGYFTERCNWTSKACQFTGCLISFAWPFKWLILMVWKVHIKSVCFNLSLVFAT